MRWTPNEVGGGGESGGGTCSRTPRVILASRSVRRRELLERHGYDFEVFESGVDDAGLARGDRDAGEWVMSLAFLKASAAVTRMASDSRETPRAGVVLGADTVCVLGEEVIGQARDEREAARIIDRFSDATHEVLTGVALLCPRTRRRDMFVDRAVVRVGRITASMRDEYLATGMWRGKAGAYNLGERLDAGWPIEFDGDPTSIMGLPMDALAPRLDAFWRPSTGAA